MLPSPSGDRPVRGDALALPVVESSQVGEVRRAAAVLSRRIGFDETAAGKMALLVTEAATNLVKHAKQGVILLRVLEEGSLVGLELLAVDRGPGMRNPERCLRDGYSTAGSPGTGLGAILRVASESDVYSSPQGTVVLARLWAGKPARSARLGLGVVNLPVAGEEVSGDSWAAHQEEGRAWLLVADGLGHGPLAADASREACRIFRSRPGRSPRDTLEAAHHVLRSTRGAAVSIAEIDLDREELHFAGVGNVSGVIVSGAATRSLVSHNGTLGHEARTFQTFSYPFPRGAVLVMYSDGLVSRWKLDGHPGLFGRDPAVIAGVLHREYQRGRDDVTVVVARERSATS